MNRFLEDEPTQQWPALRLFSLYRLTVAVIFLVLGFLANNVSFIKLQNPQFLQWVSGTYLLFAVCALLLAYFRKFSYKLQVYLCIVFDIVAIILIMHALGGVTSGFGTLLIAVVAGGSLLLPGRSALFFAAVASLALLIHEIYVNLYQVFEKTAYTQAGLLGAALFATALLAISMAKRAKESAALAAQRGIDLANMAKLNEHLVNRMDAGIMVVEDDGKLRMMNHAAWKLLGQPEANEENKLIDLSVPLHDIFKFWCKARINPDYRSHINKITRDNLADLQVRITPVGSRKHDKGSVIYLNDNSEIERQVQETKLASLGRLTASIAHEIRNPLGAISHAAQLLDESDELHKADQRLANIIQDQSIRLNNIINNVLRLSRREKPKTENIELHKWLSEFMQEFTRTNDLLPDWASIRVIPKDAQVSIDPNHLHQVLWNLCKNAKKYGQKDTLEADNTNIKMGKIQLFANINEAATTYLDVIDFGPGIDEKHQAQLFEPFFTTSDTGTGLGLYISRELCKNNAGDLRYIRTDAGGSCFRIELPNSTSVNT